MGGMGPDQDYQTPPPVWCYLLASEFNYALQCQIRAARRASV